MVPASRPYVWHPCLTWIKQVLLIYTVDKKNTKLSNRTVWKFNKKPKLRSLIHKSTHILWAAHIAFGHPDHVKVSHTWIQAVFFIPFHRSFQALLDWMGSLFELLSSGLTTDIIWGVRLGFRWIFQGQGVTCPGCVLWFVFLRCESVFTYIHIWICIQLLFECSLLNCLFFLIYSHFINHNNLYKLLTNCFFCFRYMW